MGYCSKYASSNFYTCIIFVSYDIDVDEAFEDAVISYVNMDARENVALSCRPQGMFI